MNIFGIDVSSYQGNIDWAKVKTAGCSFAILKCIQKGLSNDSKFAINVKGCNTQRIPFDVYTYVYENTISGAEARAKAAIAACKAQGVKGCTIWWDVEDSSIRKTTAAAKAALTDSINAAQKLIESAGYKFGVYCDFSFYKSNLYTDKLSCPFWVAKYGTNPTTTFGTAPTGTKPSISHELIGWQYCSKGKVAGISGYTDLNVAYGTFGATSVNKTHTSKETSSSATKKVTAKDPASSKLSSLAGTYKAANCNALNIRSGAGVAKESLVAIPAGTEVKNYGFYTLYLGVKWLYIQVTYKGIQYTGFAHSKYLTKV